MTERRRPWSRRPRRVRRHARAALAAICAPPSRAVDLYELAADYPERGGRALAREPLHLHRPGLRRPRRRAQLGGRLELLHNAFLVHDDVEDESEERRGRPTLHALHGVATAVNVGDALAVMSLRPLLDNRRRSDRA